MSEVNIEVRQRTISAHLHEFWHIKMRRFEQVKLTLHIKIKKPLNGAVWCDDPRRHACFLRLPLQFIRILAASALGNRDRKRNLIALRRRIFTSGLQDSLHQFLWAERRKLLRIFGVDVYGQANA